MRKLISIAAVAVLALSGSATLADMPNQCLSQMSRMNMWMVPKKADAERLAEAGELLTSLVPSDVRVALARGEPIPPWSPDLGQVAIVQDTLGEATRSYLFADEMFIGELGTLLVCIAQGSQVETGN